MERSRIAIYLAGTIQKGHETNESHWTTDHMEFLRRSLARYEVVLLDPAVRGDDLSDQHSVFGRDMLQVYCSSVVFVDARDRRGLGVGAEMMWAKLNRIPVLTWAPKESHYYHGHTTVLGVPVSDFIHPFVFALSDKIVGTLEEGAQWIESLCSHPESVSIKGLEHIANAMEYYKKRRWDGDLLMKQLTEVEDGITSRMRHTYQGQGDHRR